jgi:hypothetical protein
MPLGDRKYRRKYSDSFIRQVRFLLLNKELSHKDICRMCNHEISFDTIRKLEKNTIYTDVVGFEPFLLL